MTLDDDDENPSSMRKKDSKKIAAELFDATCRKENILEFSRTEIPY